MPRGKMVKRFGRIKVDRGEPLEDQEKVFIGAKGKAATILEEAIAAVDIRRRDGMSASILEKKMVSGTETINVAGEGAARRK